MLGTPLGFHHLLPQPVAASGFPGLVGQLTDAQGQPVQNAAVAVHADGNEEAIAVVESQCDGSFIVDLSEVPSQAVSIELTRPHFRSLTCTATPDKLESLRQGITVRLPDLTVVDLDFLNKTERAVRPDVVAEEMRHLGEFLLSMAQERARDQGVDAQYILREGAVATEIKAAAVDEGATVVALGHAAPDDPIRAFAPEGLLRFAQEIENETGIEARVVC